MADLLDQLADALQKFKVVADGAYAWWNGAVDDDVTLADGTVRKSVSASMEDLQASIAAMQAAADDIEYLPGDLASSDPGKGASRVSLQNGLSLQQYLPTRSLFGLSQAAYLKIHGLQIHVAGFFYDQTGSDLTLVYDAQRPKSDADGANVFDLDNVGTLTDTALGTFHSQQSTGSGNGCWIATTRADNVCRWGVVMDSQDHDSGNATAFDAIYRHNVSGCRMHVPAGTVYTTHPVVANGFHYIGAGMNGTIISPTAKNIPMTAVPNTGAYGTMDYEVNAILMCSQAYFGGFKHMQARGMSSDQADYSDYGLHGGTLYMCEFDALRIQYVNTATTYRGGYLNRWGYIYVLYCGDGFIHPYAPGDGASGTNSEVIEQLWVTSCTGQAFQARGMIQLNINQLYIEACAGLLAEFYTCPGLNVDHLNFDGCTLDGDVGDGVGIYTRGTNGHIGSIVMDHLYLKSATPAAFWGFDGGDRIRIGAFRPTNITAGIQTVKTLSLYSSGGELQLLDDGGTLLCGALADQTSNSIINAGTVERSVAHYNGGSSVDADGLVSWFPLSYPLTVLVEEFGSSPGYVGTPSGMFGYRKYAVLIKPDNTVYRADLLEESVYGPTGKLTFSVSQVSDIYSLNASISGALYTSIAFKVAAQTRGADLLREAFYP